MTPRVSARLAAVLFVATGVLLAVGVSAESDSDQDSPSVAGDRHDEQAEVAEASEGGEAHGGGGEVHDEGGEEAKVLGVDVESPASVALALVASAALAAGLWFRPSRPVALCALLVAVAFAVFDVAEVAHQLEESNSSLTVLAGVVGAGHAAAAVASGRVAWKPR